jgi:glycerophosphoryl diester phosphodiesterase
MASETLKGLYKHTPLVIAHRGASYDAPENTLAAFALARKQGADGVELDTSLSKDGVPVVIHDLSLDATTNGAGLVRNYTLKQLKEFDAGSHYDFAFRHETIPTLDEVFETVGHDMVINVELKTDAIRANGLEPNVLTVIRRHNASGRVIVSSFNPFALRRFHAIAPDIPIGYLYAAGSSLPYRFGWFMFALPHQARHPEQVLVDKEFMAWARANNFRVNTWTVDAPERIRELRDLGVDAIITNRPQVALEALNRVSTRHHRD